MTDIADLKDEATKALLERIVNKAATAPTIDLLRLAEAFAWTYVPNEPHGGSAITPT